MRRWCREQGITIAEAARRLGFPRDTIEYWIHRGHSPWSKPHIDRLIEVTGIGMDKWEAWKRIQPNFIDDFLGLAQGDGPGA